MRKPAKTKLKRRKSFLKRFKISVNKKVLHRVAFGNHLRRKKSKSQRRNYRRLVALKGEWAKKVLKFMGV